MKRILLVADPEEAPIVTAILKGANSEVSIEVVSTLPALDAATTDPHPDLRVLTYVTDVIVPKAVLDRLPGPAYNIHPGPPDLPGLFPAVHALYEGDKSFGVTAHEVAPEIDAGAIVAVLRIDIPTGCDRITLEALSRNLMQELLITLAPALIERAAPLPTTVETWGGPRRTRADFEALCQMPHDVGEAEFRRRYRAIQEGPEHALKLCRFGRTFSLDALPTDAPVVKGGRPVEIVKPDRDE